MNDNKNGSSSLNNFVLCVFHNDSCGFNYTEKTKAGGCEYTEKQILGA